MIDRPHSLRFVNGRIDPSDHVPADVLLTQGGVIHVVGAQTDAPSAEASTDLGGALMMPGLTDAHLHLLGLATERLQLALDPNAVRSLCGLLDRVSSAARRICDPHWLRGAGFDENGPSELQCPTREELAAAAPNHRFSFESFAVILRC
jgi:predicted amidohydrolase YtcJ